MATTQCRPVCIHTKERCSVDREKGTESKETPPTARETKIPILQRISDAITGGLEKTFYR